MKPIRIQIRERTTDRVKVDTQVPGLDPTDATSCLLILAREVATHRLGDPDDFRIRAWHPRNGWQEYTRQATH